VSDDVRDTKPNIAEHSCSGACFACRADERARWVEHIEGLIRVTGDAGEKALLRSVLLTGGKW
jgi:hypothetical protein